MSRKFGSFAEAAPKLVSSREGLETVESGPSWLSPENHDGPDSRDVKDGTSNAVLRQGIKSADLVAGWTNAGRFGDLNQGVVATPAAAQAPVTTTDSGSSLSTAAPTANAADPKAGEVQVDAFWRLMGSQGRRTVSPWSFDADDDGAIGL
jgi:hypothetical protein